MHSDKLSALGTFVQAAQTLSFTAAARQLDISASAEGKAIARMEARLEVRLFHRNTRSMTLTDEGRRLLERGLRILSEVEAAEADIGRKTPQGGLRVGLPLASHLFMPPVLDFMRRYPGIELELDFNEAFVNLVEEGYDVVIRVGKLRDSGLIARPLARFRYRIVGAPGYFAAHGQPRRPQDLPRHACIHYRAPSSGKLLPWPLVVNGSAARPKLPRSAIASTLEPQLCMAEQGFGLACLPSFAVDTAIEQGRLVPVLDKYLPLDVPLQAVWPASRQPSPRIQAFVSHMQAALVRQPGLRPAHGAPAV